MTIVFRVDASEQMGSGHLMRCLTLAHGLSKEGQEIIFICRDYPRFFETWKVHIAFELHLLPFNPLCSVPQYGWLSETQENDAQQTISILSKREDVDWVVVDHYGLDQYWEDKIYPYTKKLMVIDDLANRPHRADLLLDQNFYLTTNRYKKYINKECVQLLGPRFALLRPEFSRLHGEAKVREKIKRILINFGGADPQNYTQWALEALRQSSFEGVVDVVVGAANPNKVAIQKECALDYNTMYHCQTKEFAQLMVMADLAIGAGGATTWERCCLKLPAIIASIASNQHELSTDLHAEGVIVYLGPAEQGTQIELVRVIDQLLMSPKDVIRLSNKAGEIVDGLGVSRVVTEMLQSNSLDVVFRYAMLEDMEMIYHWRNHENTRRFFFDTSPVSWETHEAWYRQSLDKPSRHLLLAMKSDIPVGVFRLDCDGSSAVIDIYLAPLQVGKGLGTQILKNSIIWARTHIPTLEKLVGDVMFENKASQRAFIKAGFLPQPSKYAIEMNCISYSFDIR